MDFVGHIVGILMCVLACQRYMEILKLNLSHHIFAALLTARKPFISSYFFERKFISSFASVCSLYLQLRKNKRGIMLHIIWARWNKQ
jgi:hypothetical protein